MIEIRHVTASTKKFQVVVKLVGSRVTKNVNIRKAETNQEYLCSSKERKADDKEKDRTRSDKLKQSQKANFSTKEKIQIILNDD